MKNSRGKEFIKNLGYGKSVVEIEQEESIHEDSKQQKLINLSKAIGELEGIEIPFNIIKQNIMPLKEWLNSTLKEVSVNSSHK